MITSLPILNLPVFDGDPCAWPNWYGMFKAVVDDQQLSKTQKMICLKVSVKGTAFVSSKIELPQLNSSAETFHPLQAAIGETSTTGTPANHTTCGVTIGSISAAHSSSGILPEKRLLDA